MILQIRVHRVLVPVLEHVDDRVLSGASSQIILCIDELYKPKCDALFFIGSWHLGCRATVPMVPTVPTVAGPNQSTSRIQILYMKKFNTHLIYASAFQALLRERRCASERADGLKKLHLFAWGVPLCCVGMMFGINPSPESKGGYACWSHGIDGKNKEMWIAEVVMISITFLTIVCTIVQLNRRRSQSITHCITSLPFLDLI